MARKKAKGDQELGGGYQGRPGGHGKGGGTPGQEGGGTRAGPGKMMMQI